MYLEFKAGSDIMIEKMNWFVFILFQCLSLFFLINLDGMLYILKPDVEQHLYICELGS